MTGVGGPMGDCWGRGITRRRRAGVGVGHGGGIGVGWGGGGGDEHAVHTQPGG